MVTMDVVAAGVGIKPFLQAAPWEVKVAAVFYCSLLYSPQMSGCYIYTRDRVWPLHSACALNTNFAKMLHSAPFM